MADEIFFVQAPEFGFDDSRRPPCALFTQRIRFYKCC